MKNFLCLIGAIATAVAIFAAVAVIVKKVKFKFVISSADAEPCDYDCANCDDESCAGLDDDDEDDEDFFTNWDDIPVEEPEIEVEICEVADDDSKDISDVENIIKNASIEQEVEDELKD